MRKIKLIRLMLFLNVCLLSPFVEAAPGPIDGATHAVVGQGAYAYLGVGRQLKVVGIANHLDPVQLGETPEFPDIVQALAVDDNFVYVCAGAAGLIIVDISNPTVPKTVGHLDTEGFAQGLFISGILAYLADGPAGLRVIDISNPFNPRLLATSASEGWSRAVAVDNGIAYLAAGEAGLRVIDVIDPARPEEIGFHQTSADASDVKVAGGFAYVAAGASGLRILDITFPPELKEVGFINSIFARTVRFWNGFVYVAAERNGVMIVNAHNPRKPTLMNKFAAIGASEMVDVMGNDLLIADGIGALHVLRLSPAKTKQAERVKSLKK